MERSSDERFGEGTCYVVMGFGKKTDFESARLFDLDKTYKHVIKPAVESVGLTCVRADEVRHSGNINDPLFEALLQAQFVIADLTTSNRDALYQLGVRHALKPSGTIVIAEEGMRALPFDMGSMMVLRYRHLGEGIEFEEVERFRGVLAKVLKDLRDAGTERIDSPVYLYLPGLRVDRESTTVDIPDVVQSSAESGMTASLLAVVDQAVTMKDFSTARSVLTTLLDRSKAGPSASADPDIVRRLASVIYKSRQPTELAALMEARDLLATLAPRTSNDVESVRLWGRIHTRLWAVAADARDLDEAIDTLKRAFHLRAGYENANEYAFYLNTRAARSAKPEEAVADFVLARRVREQALALCLEWLDAHPAPPSSPSPAETGREEADHRFWTLAAMAEARVGLQEPQAEAFLESAAAAAPESWMVEVTRQRVDTLRALVADSPLKHLRVA